MADTPKVLPVDDTGETLTEEATKDLDVAKGDDAQ